MNRLAPNNLVSNPSYTRNTFLVKDTISFNEEQSYGAGVKFDQEMKLASNVRLSKIEDRQRFFEEEIHKLLTLL